MLFLSVPESVNLMAWRIIPRGLLWRNTDRNRQRFRIQSRLTGQIIRLEMYLLHFSPVVSFWRSRGIVSIIAVRVKLLGRKIIGVVNLKLWMILFQCHSKECLNHLTAITWLMEFIRHPHSEYKLLPYHADMLGAIMTCISDEEVEIPMVLEQINGDF